MRNLKTDNVPVLWLESFETYADVCVLPSGTFHLYSAVIQKWPKIEAHIGKGARLIQSMPVEEYSNKRWLVRFAYHNKNQYLICEHIADYYKGIVYSSGWSFVTSDRLEAVERYYRGSK